MPLVPGTSLTYEGDGERVVVTVTGRTRRSWASRRWSCATGVYDGTSLIEDTEDWFAQDAAGNVWYFGEDTAECAVARSPVARARGRQGSTARSPAS